jgi:hypothetical protein
MVAGRRWCYARAMDGVGLLDGCVIERLSSRAAILVLVCAALPSCTNAGDEAETAAQSESTGAVDSTGSATADDAATEADDADPSGADESSDTGPVDADACDAPPDAVQVEFALDTAEFPTGPEQDQQDGGEGSTIFSYDAACTVTAVDVDGGVVTTALDCLFDELPVSTSLSVSAPVTGTPAWSSGEAVVLSASAWLVPADGSVDASWAGLHRASDGSLLVGGGYGMGFVSPLTVDDVVACTVVEPCIGDAAAPLQGFIGEPGGESVLLTGGQHAELPLADGTTMQIDPERYHSDTSCHGYGPDIRVTMRRVAP